MKDVHSNLLWLTLQSSINVTSYPVSSLFLSFFSLARRLENSRGTHEQKLHSSLISWWNYDCDQSWKAQVLWKQFRGCRWLEPIPKWYLDLLCVSFVTQIQDSRFVPNMDSWFLLKLSVLQSGKRLLHLLGKESETFAPRNDIKTRWFVTAFQSKLRLQEINFSDSTSTAATSTISNLFVYLHHAKERAR